MKKEIEETTIDKIEIGKRVTQIRTEMGLSKVAFADLVGLTNQYLGTIERGINGLTLEKAARISTVSGVSLDYLVFGNQEASKLLELLSTKSILSDMSVKQIQIACELIGNIATFLKTDDIDDLLIKAIFEGKAR